MAVPKHKTSKSRRDTRNSSSFKVATPTLVVCPECHELKVAHKVCKKCGSYDGKKVIKVEKKEKKETK